MFLLKKIVSIGGENHLHERDNDCDTGRVAVLESLASSEIEDCEQAQGNSSLNVNLAESGERKSSTSAEDSPLDCFYDDLSETDSDVPDLEAVSKLKILREAGDEVDDGVDGTKKPDASEGRSDKRDNDSTDVSLVAEENFCKNKTIEWGFPAEENIRMESVQERFGSNRRSDPSGLEESHPWEEPLNDELEDCWAKNESIECCVVDYLGQENQKAEARLAARRQARVEAREIRLRELERQQKEQEENADKVFDMSLASDNVLRTGRVAPLINAKDRPATTNSYHSSRRSSENSLEDGTFCLRDIKLELKELDEKFRKAMIANAQLDNEKSELTYQVELLKDKLEDLEETHAQLSRENREKTREHEQLKRVAVKLKEELSFYKSQLEERDSLIADYGLKIVGGDGTEEGVSEKVLVSKENAELLQQAGDGSLDVRLKKLADERNELLDEVRHLKLELEEERSKKKSDNRSGHGSLTNGPLDEETSKLLSEYRFKLQKAEQDVSTLQANVARLESQVIRYKSAAESSEKAEDELKIEKRKLQRENRESIARIEELETANSHLMRRMDKLKNAKSTLLKEL